MERFPRKKPGLLTAITLAIYSLGFDTLGYARAQMTVPRTSPELSAFHVEIDGDHRHFRFDTETYDQVGHMTLEPCTVA